jgi:hypothetical protein
MVGMQPCEERHPHAARVERAVAIEQALLVGASNDGTEAEVLEFLRVRCCGSWLGHVYSRGIEGNTKLAGKLRRRSLVRCSLRSHPDYSDTCLIKRGVETR